jgi:hypothetical protein
MYNNPANPAWLAKRFRANQLGKSYLLESGKMNPWDLPEFDTARSNMMKERDIGLSDYARNLTRSGVEGPSAALSLEKMGQGYGNNILNLANTMRTAAADKGLNVGGNILDQANKEVQLGLQWRGQHDARRAQPNDFMKTIQGINAATGAVSNIAELGLGGAGMLGMLPGMNGVSSMAPGGGGMNIMELFKMLQRMSASGPAPSGSTYG